MIIIGAGYLTVQFCTFVKWIILMHNNPYLTNEFLLKTYSIFVSYTYRSFVLFHSKQREHQASDSGGGAQLQFHGMGERNQKSHKIDDWQKWQQESAAKLLKLQVVWDVFKRLQIVDDRVDLQSLLESVLSCLEQQKSLNKGLSMRIRTACGSYLIEMEVRISSIKCTTNVLPKHP